MVRNDYCSQYQNYTFVNSKFTALVVDDEKEICYLLSKILKNKGIETNFVNTLGDAKIFLEKYSPAVIFLDNHLPDGLGEEFIHYVKQNYPLLKIIIITGKEIDIEKAVNNGAFEVISKPFTIDRIFSVLEKHA